MAGEEKLVYSAFGASCSEVEVNMLTGERRVLRADIMMDAGNSLSPAIDAGQVSLKHSYKAYMQPLTCHCACKGDAVGLCLKGALGVACCCQWKPQYVVSNETNICTNWVFGIVWKYQ